VLQIVSLFTRSKVSLVFTLGTTPPPCQI